MLYAHSSDIVINFYNDRVKEIIAESEITKPFTFVPIHAGHMELVCGNAIVFGKITEGYDPIKIEVDVEKSYLDISSEASRADISVGQIEAGRQVLYDEGLAQFYTQITRYYLITFPVVVREDAIYYIRVVHGSIDNAVSYQAQSGDTGTDVRDELNDSMNTTFGVGSSVHGSNGYSVHLFSDTLIFWWQNGQEPEITDQDIFPYSITSYVSDEGLTAKYPDLKKGASHSFGIVYKDAIGRQCSVIRDAGMSVYIPFYSEDLLVNPQSLAQLTFKLNHVPPAWAKTYEIVYAGNVSMDNWLQIRVDDVEDIGDDRYSLSVKATIDYTRLKNNRWRVADWIWEAGDRIRIIGSISDTDGAVTVETDLYDYEIEAMGTQYGDVIGGEWLIIQAVNKPAAFDSTSNLLVEIYRPRKGLGLTVYYGVGMVFEIGEDENGGLYHKGDIDQVLSPGGLSLVPAQIYNVAQDCWKFSRLNYKHGSVEIFPFWAESYLPSDWWENPQRIINGWPFLYDISRVQTVLDERLRHGGFLITGTEINNIADFTYDDFIDLPKRDGDITGLREIGFTLKVLQLHKETSIYIQRIQTFNPDGTEQFTLIDRLLGTSRPMDSEYGCQNPESVLVNDRYLYYWDNNQCEFIRSAPNGQIAISGPEYKCSRWFKDLLPWIKENGGASLLKVHTGANNEHKEIWVTFQVNDQVKGMIFSEKNIRWTSRINLTTEGFAQHGNFFCHLYHQKVYIFNQNEDQPYLSWIENETYAEFEFPSAIQPDKNKIFQSVALYINDHPSCLSGFIRVPLEASYAYMKSYVAVWNKSEGIFFGRILKDENSPGNFVSSDDMTMNGRDLRGRYCLVRVRISNHTKKVKVFMAEVMSTISEGTV